MKKLFFVLLLITGFSFNSDAQELEYYLNNSSTNVWNFAMDDASLMPAQYELNMGTGVTTGSYGPTFALPLEWKAEDSNGCYVTGVIASAPLSGSAITTCGTTVNYKIQQASPNLFEMKFVLP